MKRKCGFCFSSLSCHMYKLEFFFSIFILTLREGKKKVQSIVLVNITFWHSCHKLKSKIIPYIYFF